MEDDSYSSTIRLISDGVTRWRYRYNGKCNPVFARHYSTDCILGHILVHTRITMKLSTTFTLAIAAEVINAAALQPRHCMQFKHHVL